MAGANSYSRYINNSGFKSVAVYHYEGFDFFILFRNEGNESPKPNRVGFFGTRSVATNVSGSNRRVNKVALFPPIPGR